MEKEDNMPKSNDRNRVKDRVIEGIAKAVKHIQSYQLSQPVGEDQGVILKNSDWQFHKLVENLDHAFLYGLRHFTNGYWVVVQEFTHKSVIEDIVKMSNVLTNLGRSRAWLYLALSDHLLESYVLCFIKNSELVRKHYVKEALVLDDQRLQLLLTLSSGLDLIAFELDVDVQHLDLCSYLKVRTESQEEEVDDLSLCSMISSQSQNSSTEETNHPRLTISPLSMLANLIKPLTAKQIASSLTPEETKAEKVLRIENFEAQPLVQSVEEATTPDDMTLNTTVTSEVEVIHVKPKSRRSRKKDRCQKSSSATESDSLSIDSSVFPLSPNSSESSGYRSVPEDAISTQCADSGINVLNSHPGSSGESVIENERSCDLKSPGKGLVEKDEVKEDLTQDEKLLRILSDSSDPPVEKVCFSQEIEWKTFAERPAQQPQPADVKDIPCSQTTDKLSISSHPENSEQLHTAEQDEKKLPSQPDKLASPLTSSVEEPSIYDDGCPLTVVVKPSTESHFNALTGKEGVSSLVESSSEGNRSVPRSVTPVFAMEPEEEEKSLSAAGTASPVTADCYLEMNHPAEIEVDNNLKVVLMLDIFLHEEESLLKMFRTCQGHTEGDVLVTYIIITTHSVYLLKPSSRPNKFIREVAINFKELDYVSISLNYQILHIVCRSRHNQFWITTGDEVLTRIIVSHLTRAVSRNHENTSPSSASSLTVLTDATAQKISIAKRVSEELDIPRQGVSLLSYSLVHWEDSEAIVNGDLQINCSHEGFLHHRMMEETFMNYLFSGASWNHSYFVLEQGTLHQYPNSKCSGPPIKSVSLSPDQCHGCRRCPSSDRKHCFEILLANGSNLELSASSDAELQEWLIKLRQATCDQTGSRAAVFGCVACCCVVAQSHVFMCHEDLQTNFLRTLGCLSLSYLTQVQTDAGATSYCVLVYKKVLKLAGQEGMWCVYFNSLAERDRFLKSVQDVRTQLKQPNLCTSQVDAKLSKRCRMGITKLMELHKGGRI